MSDHDVPVDPPMHDLKDKGLRRGSVSLVGAVAIGLAATAPAYSLTGALGYGALESGYQLPIIFVISVIPMLFVALAYKHGIPGEVLHIIATHSHEGDKMERSIEAIIFHHADFVDFDIAKLLGKRAAKK